MNVLRLRHKLLLVVGTTISVVFGAIAFFTSAAGERAILADHQRALHKMTDSVAKAIESIMLEDHAEIMTEFSHRLRSVKDIQNFQILRIDGTEAFLDNLTIDTVNEKLGARAFDRRLKPQRVPIRAIDPDTPSFKKAITTGVEVATEMTDERYRVLEFFDPIPNDVRCHRCHDASQRVRGIIRVTAPLDRIDREIEALRLRTLLLLLVAATGTMLVTGYMLGRSVIRPIEAITRAMARIAHGDLDQRVPYLGNDEIGKMAKSFNLMSDEIRDGQNILERERQKLTTIIHGAREAIVVTNAEGRIVLVNAAASELLGKTEAQIRNDGFSQLFDDPAIVTDLLGRPEGQRGEIIHYRNRALQVSASRITDDVGATLGSAALIRDISEEQRLLLELRRISITDTLTGLYNRRHLDTTLTTEIHRSQRSGQPLSVILFDIDHFKRFNDTYGHDQGDRVLRAVGATMRAAVRPYDIPCRYGGEEFCAILPKTDAKTAVLVAERMRLAVAATIVDALQVTISLGVASSDGRAPPSGSDLLEAADAALYRAKDAGRNQTALAAPPATTATS